MPEDTIDSTEQQETYTQQDTASISNTAQRRHTVQDTVNKTGNKSRIFPIKTSTGGSGSNVDGITPLIRSYDNSGKVNEVSGGGLSSTLNCVNGKNDGNKNNTSKRGAPRYYTTSTTSLQ